jgi:hypothetical protein
VDPLLPAWMRTESQDGRRKQDLHRLLLDFYYLQGKLSATDPNALIEDYDYLQKEWDLSLIQSAIRLSASALSRDFRQLAGQLMGRIADNSNRRIRSLLKQAAHTKPWAWLRPLKATLQPPRGPLIRILKDDLRGVDTVKITPDACRSMTFFSHKVPVRVRDLETGRMVKTFKRGDPCGDEDVIALITIHGGYYAVSSRLKGTIWIWNLDDGQNTLLI